jgi:4-amino-4-deoxy-L-arabinose transferase-like glycosyltransferase
MKKTGMGIILALLVVSIIFSQIKLSNHPIIDNDEGIYLTSFLLINKGNPPYKATYFSQPPGFILAAYPGFTYLGKSLSAARLTTGVCSVIGLLAVISIFYELGSIWAGILCVSLLYLIRYYTNQTVTFQSDAIVTSFSLLSFSALLHYLKTSKIVWLIVSGVFLNFAFWTKFDVILIPVFLTLLWYVPKSVKISKKLYTGALVVTSVIFLIIFIVPFGITEVFQNSVLLRLQSVTQSTGPFELISLLQQDAVLSSVIIGTFLLIFLSRDKIRFPANLLIIWFFSSFVFFFFYRPLFPHHMAILSVPAAMTFSYITYLLFSSKTETYRIAVLVILVISAVNYSYTTFHTKSGILSREQQTAVDIIKKNTAPDDYVVSDEEILSGISGRLPPPELSDVSFVRIRSGNLSPERFSDAMAIYKPKLLISWSGRLKEMKNFSAVLNNYTKLITLNGSKEIFVIKASR